MEDSKIIQLLWDRAENALEAVARRFGARLYQTAMNILGSFQDAEESVNDTYLAVWNTIPPKKPNPLAGFVYKIGRNNALNRMRSNLAQKRNNTYDLSLEELEGCIPGPALEAQLDARELGRLIDRFLDTLSPENRHIFLRRYWFGDGVNQIAKSFSLSQNTVSVRLRRMREGLRTYLIKEGYYE